MTIVDCMVAFAFGVLFGFIVGFAFGQKKGKPGKGSFAYRVGPPVQKGKK